MKSSRAPPSLPLRVSCIPDSTDLFVAGSFTVRSLSAGQQRNQPSWCRPETPQTRCWGCSIMSSEGVVSAVEPRLRRLASWFDPESAAVVTILLGLFQMLLSASLAHTDPALPKLFILSLVMGILIVTGGAFTIANERNPSRRLLQGCACSNAIGLLGALLAFCLYCYSLNTAHDEDRCQSDPQPDPHSYHYSYHYSSSYYHCPPEHLAAYTWSVTLLLLLYDCVAVVMHCLLSVSAYKTLQ
ncbi:uncharacterized protein si:dkey-9i23.16 [Acanthochromis polyacanthus]|uniref:uncharacterized protein si:dkey-9i23.16 n=1 Tax=Acanthochromis polyacanthus TaxID=80966 RepID=UPI002234CCAA|nr:uncharacterized protein si:dkey-9i23.16 [Acanthochromis polyacanthus]